MTVDFKAFYDLFKSQNIEITKPQYERFSTYAKMLVEWNEKINLTAILDPEGIAVKHFLDSVLPFSFIEIKEGSKLIDVGTGAGFPSCPLKIMRDDISLTLLDGLNKRINFLKELSDGISLNAECVHGRAEEFGKKEDFRERFDVACARAVANLPELCEYCMPFVKLGGVFVALKGSGAKDEVKISENAVKTLGGRIEKVVEYKLPNGDGRTLVVIKKVSQTPIKYPRNKGQMTKKPL